MNEDNIYPGRASFRTRSADLYGPHPTKETSRFWGRTHHAMGTAFTVYFDVRDEIQALACFQSVCEEIDRVESTFSRFRPSSELSRLNREAAAGPVVTDPEVFQLLATALQISRATEGVFDITVGCLTTAWGFSTRQPKVPDTETLAKALETVGWNYVELDQQWRTVRFLKPGIELDLGGIAKGYAVDRAVDFLRSLGVSALIDGGSSSIAATDEAFAHNWQMSIAHPMDASQTLCEFELGQWHLSTSGVREQSFVENGRTYSHLVDPTAGSTSANSSGSQVLQATVIAPSSTLADALSTAMFLLGPERGRKIAEQFSSCAAFWVCSDDAEITCAKHRWPDPIT